MLTILTIAIAIILIRTHLSTTNNGLLELFFCFCTLFLTIIFLISFPIRIVSVFVYTLDTASIYPLLIIIKNFLQKHISVDVHIFLLQISYSLYVFSIFRYTVITTRSSSKKLPRYFFTLLLIPFFNGVIYNPLIYKYLLHDKLISPFLNSLAVNLIFDFCSDGLRIIELVLLLASFIKIVIYYTNQPQKDATKKIALYKLLLLTPLILFGLILFLWSPAKLLDLSSSGHFFFMNRFIEDRVLLAYVTLIIWPFICLYMMVILFYFKKLTQSLENKQKAFIQSIHTASLSIKVFNHSIKNHLLSIQYELEHLRKEVSNSEAAEYSINLIEQSINHSISTLNFTKDQLKDYFPITSLNGLDLPVERALSRIRTTPGNITIRQEFTKTIPFCYIDVDSFTEVIYNLIINSIEAIGTQKNGEIIITIREQVQWSVIIIHDNGCGIEADDLENIFTPFNSSKSSTTNWGLGLSYCYKILHSHNGDISVTSEPEVGTTFKIMIPNP